MKTYGLDVGTSHNALVELDGNTLRAIPILASLPTGLANASSWASATWANHSKAIAAEIVNRSLFPIGIDAALSLAKAGDARPWETVARGFHTPSSLSPLPQSGSAQQRGWWILARLWSGVLGDLARSYGARLWDGWKLSSSQEVPLIVEVYPRMSWIALSAAIPNAVTTSYGAASTKQGILAGLGLAWGSPKKNDHHRDAAVCAATVQSVLNGSAGFLGEPVVVGTPCRGGGIAIPWVLPPPGSGSRAELGSLAGDPERNARPKPEAEEGPQAPETNANRGRGRKGAE